MSLLRNFQYNESNPCVLPLQPLTAPRFLEPDHALTCFCCLSSDCAMYAQRQRALESDTDLDFASAIAAM